MERPYSNDTASDVVYFTGTEVEKTPAFGVKTLFVVGLQPVDEILRLASEHECENIYIGANQSYTDPDDECWNELVLACLSGFNGYVTCDIPHHFIANDESYMDWVSGWSEYNNFIAMIAVRLPYIGLHNYNATIKIDDTDFNSTNPGVWCHSLHELKSRDHYTNWRQYTKDNIITSDS